MKEEKPKKGKTIILVIVGLIAIGMCSFCGFYIYKSYDNSDTNIEKSYIDVGEIIVKLADDDGKKYLKVNMSVGYDKSDRKAKKQLKKTEQLPVVQDALNFYLMSKKSDFFKGDYEKQLKEGLISAINKKVQDFKIEDVKISNLIIQ